LQSDDYDAIQKERGIKIEEHPGVTNFAIKFNNQKGLTANKDIRKAIAYAVDYDAFMKIYNGHAKLMEGPIPQAFKGHAPKLPVYRTDLAKAKEHLAKAGHPNGGFTLEYVYVAGLEEERLIGLVLIDQLKKLNITVNMVGAALAADGGPRLEDREHAGHDGGLRDAPVLRSGRHPVAAVPFRGLGRGTTASPTTRTPRWTN